MVTVEVPSEKSRAGRVALIVAAGVLGTALVAYGLWLAFRPPSGPPKQSRIEPAARTEPATLPPLPAVTPTSSAGATSSTGATGAAVPTSTPGGGGGATRPAAGRAEKIAFRLGGSVYVADEDGTGARAVARFGSGPYALSPDGSTLAAVPSDELVLVDVSTGAQVSVDPAQQVTPVWKPDSSRVMWVRSSETPPGASQVWSVAKDGGDAKLLVNAADRVSVSPDGRVLLARPWLSGTALPGSFHVLVSKQGGAFRPVEVPGIPTALGASNRRAFVGISNPRASAANKISLISMDFSGGHGERILGKPSGDVMAAWSELCVSPDGMLLAAGALGDDEYSRAWIIPLGGGDAVLVTPRRDGYVHGWSASGRELYLVDGNAYQGETTALLVVDGASGSRRLLVTGAQ